jgi:dihydrofolate reductase
MVYPVLLGKGKRLFGETGEPKSLKLTSSQPAGETTILVYEPAGS